MAKITGPLLSLSARGSIGKSMTFSSAKGVPYVRQLVIPANPKSTAQVLTRDIFTNFGLRWKTGGAIMRSPWDRFADGTKAAGRNYYMGKNLAATRGESDLDDYIGSPGAKGGLAPASMVLTTAASLGIEAVVTVPALPTGWTITAVQVTCFKEQTPEATVGDVIQEGEDLAAAPYQVDFTGLVAVEYQVQAWIKWAKPDLSVAYGASIVDQIVVTA